MKKEDFLRELDSRLHILNEAERKDILDEYAQHIDFKIANGLSEEDAAGDFGDIKELASEILSAYNVNLKYNKPDVADTYKRIGSRIKKWFLEHKDRASGCWGRFKNKIKEYVEKNNEYSEMRTERKLQKIREESMNEPKDAKEFQMNISNPPVSKKSSMRIEREFTALKRMPGKLLRSCCKVLVFFMLVPIGLGTISFLFVFGSCLVLTFQGYPLAGITIGSAGVTMCIGALTVLFGGYCFGKRERGMEYGKENHVEE